MAISYNEARLGETADRFRFGNLPPGGAENMIEVAEELREKSEALYGRTIKNLMAHSPNLIA